MLEILAQDSTTAPAPGGFGAQIIQMAPLILILVLFYVLIIRSKRKQEKDRQNLIDSLKKNDRVQTIGGMLGTVMQVDGAEVVVKVDEGTNTKIRFVRSAIHRVISDETKTETK